MFGDKIIGISGASVDADLVEEIAKKINREILSELPEKAQTVDVVSFVLDEAKNQIKGARIRL